MPTRILRDWTDSLPLADLSPEGERFFVRLIMKADDYGRFHGDERLLKAALFPLLADVRLQAVRKWRDECTTAGLLALYQDRRGREFIEIANFNQRTRAKDSKFPNPGECETIDGHLSDMRPSCAGHPRSETETSFGDGDEDSSELGEPASKQPDNPVFIEIPTVGRGAKPYPVTENQIKGFETYYPGIDVRAELRNCAGWNVGNPQKRKTVGGMTRHINAWLAKAQNGQRWSTDHSHNARPGNYKDAF